MTKSILSIFALFLALTVMPLAVSMAQAEDMSKSDVEDIVKNYILENPQVLIESLEKFRIAQEQQEQLAQEAKLSEHSEFFTDDNSPAIGNPDGDITIVEFFDYNCGYCKKALTEVTRLVKEDDNIRVIFKEMPILGPSSLEASKWAMAARKQGNEKYFTYHTALMNHSGAKNEKTLERLAKDSGLNVDQLRTDKNDPSIMDDIGKILSVSNDIGVRGTPAFVINGELYRGYLPYAQMKDVIKNLRAQ